MRQNLHNSKVLALPLRLETPMFNCSIITIITIESNSDNEGTYLGGFAGGSDLLLSTSENGAFFNVVIIRGGFGGP